MTNKTITLTVPNDDAIALHHLGEAMQRMAGAHGFVAPEQVIERITEQVGEVSVTHEKVLDTTFTKGMSKDEMRDKLFAAQDAAKDDRHTAHVEGATTGPVVENNEPQITAEQAAELFSTGEDSSGQWVEVTDTDTDSTGTPWDERIHAESRALNSDNTWRARRKPKDMEQAEWEQYVESVKAELSGEEQLELLAVDSKPVIDVKVTEGNRDEREMNVEVTITPAPVAPPVTAPVTAPIGDLPTDFIGLLQWLTGNGFNSVVVDPVLKSRDLPNLTALKDTPEMIPQFAQAVADYARGVE